ncbi:MAG: sulfatase-like hydrolase/transferase [Acidobacteriota bacterium]
MNKRSMIFSGLFLGLIMGVSLFIVESFFVMISGKRIPASYLSLTLLFDAGGGLISGLLAGCFSLIASTLFYMREEERGFDLLQASILFFLIFFFGFFFLHGRILMGTRFYESKGLLATLLLTILCLVLSLSFYFFCPLIRKRLFPVYPTGLLEMIFSGIIASGYLWLNEYKLAGARGTYRFSISMALLIVLSIVYLLANFVISRIMRRREIPLDRSALRFSRNAITLLLIGLSLLWFCTHIDAISCSSHEQEWKIGSGAGNSPINVIVVSIDTLRASNLSCYGYSRKTTPWIDQFAEDALLFTNAVSSSSWTLPAHASLFTGLIPYRHGAHYADRPPAAGEHYPLDDLDMTGVFPLPADATTVAEILKKHDYTNVAFVSNFAALSASLGMDQGFDIYMNRERTWVSFKPFFHRILATSLGDYGTIPDFISRTTKPFLSAKVISDEVIRWLERRRKEPFFLFLNYMEPHRPYLPYSPFNRKFLQEKIFSMKDPFWEVMGNHRALSEREKRYLLSQYDGEIAYADHHIGRLFQTLREMGLYEASLIVVLSDHGEMFGEHNLLDHTNSLYEEVLRIPLIVKYPFSKKTGILHSRVGIVDVMPEILSVLGKEIPRDLDGAPFETGNRNPLAELYINRYYFREFGERFGSILRAKYDQHFKLIISSSGRHELYQLIEDPLESKNLVYEYPDVKDRLLQQVEHYLMDKKPVMSHEWVDQETRDKLRSLGYLD